MQLLAKKVDNSWSLALKYWRNYIAMYINQLCHHAANNSQSIVAMALPDEHILQDWLIKIPPISGAEYATITALKSIWISFDDWCRDQPSCICVFVEHYVTLCIFKPFAGHYKMKTLNIYINGTDETNLMGNSGVTSLANVLHKLTVDDDNQDSHSICLEGCAVHNYDPRDLGIIFTFRLVNQIKQLENDIRERVQNGHEKLRLNLYGFSRGGAGVFLLCQNLRDISPNKIEINVVSFEPVPGNFITGVYAGSFLGINYSLSSMVYDLGDCNNINNTLVLFTNEPIPDIACHGPILPAFPQTAISQTEVLPGCHKAAELFKVRGNMISSYNNESAIAFHHVVSFLQKQGTKFDFNKVSLSAELVYLTEEMNLTEQGKGNLRRLYNIAKNGFPPVGTKNRAMHFGNTIFMRPTGKHLNTFHQELENVPVNSDDIMLNIQDRKPKAISAGHSYTGYAIQLVMTLATAMYFYNRFSSDVVEGSSLQNNI